MLSVSVWAMKRPVRMTKFAVFEWECRKERKIYMVEMCAYLLGTTVETATIWNWNAWWCRQCRVQKDQKHLRFLQNEFSWLSHRCVVVPSQRKSIIREGDEIKVVLTRLIRADNLCCSTLMNGGFLCIYSLLSSIETIYLLSGTSCQDVDFFLSDFHDVGLVLASWKSDCVYTPSGTIYLRTWLRSGSILWNSDYVFILHLCMFGGKLLAYP